MAIEKHLPFVKEDWDKRNIVSCEKLVELYNDYFQTCDVLLEIGSAHGKDADYIRKKLFIEKSNVIIIEPHLECFNLIRKLYKYYDVHNIAFGDKNIFIKFNCVMNTNHGMSSVLHRTDDYYDDKVIVRDVKMVRGDSFFKEHNINKIDICKIDVEGFTYEVLVGLGSHIKAIKFITVECEEGYYWKNQRLKNDVYSYLKKSGFRLIMEEYAGYKQTESYWLNSKFKRRLLSHIVTNKKKNIIKYTLR